MLAFAAQGHDSILTSEQAGGMQVASWLLRPEPPQRTPVVRESRGTARRPCRPLGQDFPVPVHVPEGRREPVGGNAGGRRAGDRRRQPPMSAPSNAVPQRQVAAGVCTEAGHIAHLFQEDRSWFFFLSEADYTIHVWSHTYVCVCVHI